jgi:hypothetical protein
VESWIFLTSHARILVGIARDSGVRLREECADSTRLARVNGQH